MSVPTYGEFLDRAFTHARHGLRLDPSSYASRASTAQQLAGFRQLLGAVQRQAEFLRGPGTDLAAALSRAPKPPGTHPPAGPWHSAAEAIGIGHDLLATHLGPERQYLTPDAAAIDQGQRRDGTVARLADLASVALVHHADLRSRWRLGAGQALLDTTPELVVSVAEVRRQIRTADVDLGSIIAAGHLPTSNHPAVLFERLRIAAHRQSRGTMPAGIADVRMHARVAAHVLATAAAAASDPVRLQAASRAWLHVDELASALRSTTTGPRGLHYAASELVRTLGGDARRAGDLAIRLPDLSRALPTIVHRLHSTGSLLGPVRDTEAFDASLRWVRANPDRLDGLLHGLQHANRASDLAVKAPRSAPTGPPLARHLRPRTEVATVGQAARM